MFIFYLSYLQMSYPQLLQYAFLNLPPHIDDLYNIFEHIEKPLILTDERVATGEYPGPASTPHPPPHHSCPGAT
jgi:hypothetical protein